ncbi:MAG: ABC transporter ATP-binding protein [Burkholderiaceae bacterium]
MSLLKLSGVTRSFGGVRAVDGVSFALEAGSVTALIGPNGAGKSTLFNLIDGQLSLDAGAIAYSEAGLAGLSTAARTRLGIGRTFQVSRVFGSMTVLQNAQLARQAALGAAYSIGAPLPRQEEQSARELLVQVDLEEHAAQPAAALAYGDVKRLELGLALASSPRLLLMDEPTAGMAPGERVVLMERVVGLARDRGLTVLFTEHSMEVVFGFAQRLLVLSRGRLIADGAPQDVRADATVQAVYLGSEG